MKRETKEPQYKFLFDLRDRLGFARLGLMTNEAWHQDPKRLLFVLSRYKFVGKMLQGKKRVLEVGCGDAFGARIVQQAVGSVFATDFDPVFIEDARERADQENWPIEFAVHDYIEGPFEGEFDAAYSLDVLEHIAPEYEDVFIRNVSAALTDRGVFIVGMPSVESQIYASPQSREGHVNCKKGEDLKLFMERYFDNVFLFSMNDEMVHTGYARMANYVIAVCVGKRST